MLARDMRNRDIQFYFNRQDRPVNSGRISQIRSGTYGANVPSASDAALDAFLAGFKPAEVGVVVEAAAQTSLEHRARQRFVRHRDGHWFLPDGETADQECKETYYRKKLNPILRAIAALANHSGGYIFVGVHNADFRVVGLQDDSFEHTDIATIVDKSRDISRLLRYS